MVVDNLILRVIADIGSSWGDATTNTGTIVLVIIEKKNNE